MNGTKFPNVVGLEFVWARESDYPTSVPAFFGTCPVDSDIQVEGVLNVFAQADWERMRVDETIAIQKSLDTAPIIGKSSEPVSSKGVAGDELGMLVLGNTTMYYCTANYNGIDNIWVKQAWQTTGNW
jgi:hypothetical protein